MPNFTVRRRKPAPKTPPPQEEEEMPNVEEKESDEELMSEYSDSEQYLDNAIEGLKLTNLEPRRRQVHFEPQTTPKNVPRPQYRPPFAPSRPPHQQNLPQRTPQRTIADPYSRNPTMQNRFQRPQTKRGGAKMRYRSHYGVAGEHFDTRTKANLLYMHCFQ